MTGLTVLAVVAAIACGLAVFFASLGALLDDGLCFAAAAGCLSVGVTCWLLWFALPVYA